MAKTEYIYLIGPTEAKVIQAVQAMANAYSDTPFSVGISIYRDSKERYVIHFSNSPDFERFKDMSDWDHFIRIQNSKPEELWTKYSLNGIRNEITLYSPFEYVGTTKVATTKFEVLQVDANNLILKNAEVQLRFIKTGP